MAPSTEQLNLARPDRQTIRALFNRISSKYDFLNSFLSLGLERHWRRQAVRLSLTGLEESILDLGAGTGKSLAEYFHAHRFPRAVGCDFSEDMLGRAEKRLGSAASFVVCDFHELPFPSNTFDLVTGSFILRSVQDMNQFLSEVKRVLKTGGKAVFLELTRPTNPFVWRCLYWPYLRFYIPLMGQLLSRHDHAYQFLSQSIEAFPNPGELRKQFESCGFLNLRLSSLSLGAATVVEGFKGADEG